jgi:hypothetical protein
MFTDITQLRVRKNNSQAFKDSISLENGQHSSQVNVQARKIELHVSGKSGVQYNFRRTIGALAVCKEWSTVVLKPHVETRTVGHIFQ